MHATVFCVIEPIKRIASVSGARLPEINSIDTAEEQISRYVDNIRQAWDSAVFSNKSDESIQRYFRYVEMELCQAITECADVGVTASLLNLLDILTNRHAVYADTTMDMPRAFAVRFVDVLRVEAGTLFTAITDSCLNPDLKSCLLPFLDEMLNGAAEYGVSLAALRYFQNLINSLSAVDWKSPGGVDGTAAGILESLNFNHLGFFTWRLQALNASLPEDPACRLCGLRELLVRYHLKRQSPAYDPAWPDLSDMLCGWLAEEVRFAETCLLKQQALTTPVQKLPLNTSVAHLALIVRMFVEEKLIAQESLTLIFHFFSRHFRTKRQGEISSGSFSKEYYSAGQVTAAVVRDYFLRMARRIDHDFFPVWVVISAVTLAAPGIG